ncbi:hypothetical protein GQ43DRAFT_194880 [Delitschia confertaspora ATCC 74209]|uniref:Uncharacterized protein n=1 Tax=Delitschia confertaspora ATCC 74209 TaxID=1513339 RepID=A0A9P4JE29_9PLEO|nr:hypothetical protein GQ43DRAFT_194880 [Delitschia confertaspora ATCC 74209]
MSTLIPQLFHNNLNLSLAAIMAHIRQQNRPRGPSSVPRPSPPFTAQPTHSSSSINTVTRTCTNTIKLDAPAMNPYPLPNHSSNDPSSNPQAPEFWIAMKKLEFSTIDDLEQHFFTRQEFLIPWSDFRDHFLLLQPQGMPRVSLPGQVTRERILWWYTQYDEGGYRFDPLDMSLLEDDNDDQFEYDDIAYAADDAKYGRDTTPLTPGESSNHGAVLKNKKSVPELSDLRIVDKSTWGVTSHEKHLYVHMLQLFRVGRTRNSQKPPAFKYFLTRNICTAYEKIFQPIIHELVHQYDIRGRQYYGRLAMFVEKIAPSRLAFPESNVVLRSQSVNIDVRDKSTLGALREKTLQRQETRRQSRLSVNKAMIEEEKAIRRGFEKWNPRTEKPDFDIRGWIDEQRVLAHRNQARMRLEGDLDQDIMSAGLGPERRGRDQDEWEYERMSKLPVPPQSMMIPVAEETREMRNLYQQQETQNVSARKPGDKPSASGEEKTHGYYEGTTAHSGSSGLAKQQALASPPSGYTSSYTRMGTHKRSDSNFSLEKGLSGAAPLEKSKTQASISGPSGYPSSYGRSHTRSISNSSLHKALPGIPSVSNSPDAEGTITQPSDSFRHSTIRIVPHHKSTDESAHSVQQEAASQQPPALHQQRSQQSIQHRRNTSGAQKQYEQEVRKLERERQQDELAHQRQDAQQYQHRQHEKARGHQSAIDPALGSGKVLGPEQQNAHMEAAMRFARARAALQEQMPLQPQAQASEHKIITALQGASSSQPPQEPQQLRESQIHPAFRTNIRPVSKENIRAMISSSSSEDSDAEIEGTPSPPPRAPASRTAASSPVAELAQAAPAKQAYNTNLFPARPSLAHPYPFTDCDLNAAMLARSATVSSGSSIPRNISSSPVPKNVGGHFRHPSNNSSSSLGKGKKIGGPSYRTKSPPQLDLSRAIGTPVENLGLRALPKAEQIAPQAQETANTVTAMGSDIKGKGQAMAQPEPSHPLLPKRSSKRIAPDASKKRFPVVPSIPTLSTIAQSPAVPIPDSKTITVKKSVCDIAAQTDTSRRTPQPLERGGLLPLSLPLSGKSGKSQIPIVSPRNASAESTTSNTHSGTEYANSHAASGPSNPTPMPRLPIPVFGSGSIGVDEVQKAYVASSRYQGPEFEQYASHIPLPLPTRNAFALNAALERERLERGREEAAKGGRSRKGSAGTKDGEEEVEMTFF